MKWGVIFSDSNDPDHKNRLAGLLTADYNGEAGGFLLERRRDVSEG